MPGSGKPKKQFSRPGIDITPTERRAWKSVMLSNLVPGDLVADWGQVRSMQEHPHGMLLEFDHRTEFVNNTDTSEVFAFVRVDG